jgi:large subunit ribosomal protein L30
VSDKGQRTVRIKWVRSGIGFSYHQKGIVRSLGLKKLNQEVERPDTPQIRGLVAKVPHLVKIVEASSKAAWTAVPEYTISAPEAAASKLTETAPKAAAEETEKTEAPVSPSPAPLRKRGRKQAVEATGEVTSVPAAGAPEPPLVETATAAEAATKTAGDLAATKPRKPADTRAKKSAPARKKAGAKKGRPKARTK